MPEVDSAVQQLLQAGLELPAEKKLYFNGFALATSAADFVIVLMYNNQPMALLNGSHSTVKTLLKKLEQTIRDFEEETGQPILTLDEISSAIASKGQNE
jgi:hypothetical protein